MGHSLVNINFGVLLVRVCSDFCMRHMRSNFYYCIVYKCIHIISRYWWFVVIVDCKNLVVTLWVWCLEFFEPYFITNFAQQQCLKVSMGYETRRKLNAKHSFTSIPYLINLHLNNVLVRPLDLMATSLFTDQEDPGSTSGSACLCLCSLSISVHCCLQWRPLHSADHRPREVLKLYP